jgi:hypothetical protein
MDHGWTGGLGSVRQHDRPTISIAKAPSLPGSYIDYAYHCVSRNDQASLYLSSLEAFE